MHASDASWQTSAHLRRIRSLLLARVVETKLYALERALKANFDPNQPRVAAGNSDGGQWTTEAAGAEGKHPTDASPRCLVVVDAAGAATPKRRLRNWFVGMSQRPKRGEPFAASTRSIPIGSLEQA